MPSGLGASPGLGAPGSQVRLPQGTGSGPRALCDQQEGGLAIGEKPRLWGGATWARPALTLWPRAHSVGASVSLRRPDEASACGVLRGAAVVVVMPTGDTRTMLPGSCRAQGAGLTLLPLRARLFLCLGSRGPSHPPPGLLRGEEGRVPVRPPQCAGLGPSRSLKQGHSRSAAPVCPRAPSQEAVSLPRLPP